MNRTMTTDLFIPDIIRWMESLESAIRENGTELTPDQKIDAYLVGVKDIESIRVSWVKALPKPLQIEVKILGQRLEIISEDQKGFAFGHHLCLLETEKENRELWVEKLVRVMQIENCGSVQAYLERYFTECQTFGKANMPLEKELQEIKTRLLS